MSFSKIFDRHDRRLMSLYCRKCEGELDFLKMGVTTASFQLFGKMAYLRDLLNSAVRGSKMRIAVNLSNFVEMLSGQVDLTM